MVKGPEDEGILAHRVDAITAGFDGLQGDAHAGLTRKACVRTKALYRRGTEIRNVRQITIVSVEELAQIAETLGVPRIEPEWLGANLLVTGIPALTTLTPSTRLSVADGASLVVDLENEPCRYPADVIEARFPGHGRGFVKAARHRRGVTAWVEREGQLAVGNSLIVHLPPQRLYGPAAQ